MSYGKPTPSEVLIIMQYEGETENVSSMLNKLSLKYSFIEKIVKKSIWGHSKSMLPGEGGRDVSQFDDINCLESCDMLSLRGVR